MAKNLRSVRVVILILLAAASAQAQYGTPVEYLDFFNRQLQQITQQTFNYSSSVAHGKSARKQEKQRQEVIATLRESRATMKQSKGYDGDVSLRDGFIEYVQMTEDVFTEDYGKVVDLEEIAEQSYDNMEAYLLAQEKAHERLELEQEKARTLYGAFAAKHRITLIDYQSDLQKKVVKSNEVNKYYHQLFLIFFKSSKQEGYLVDAQNQGNLNALEQNRSALATFATEGLEKLKKIPPYQGDASLVSACRTALQFYAREADEKLQPVSDYLVRKQEFEKVKANFDALRPNERTKAAVDLYNTRVDEMNKALDVFNKTNRDLNQTRNQINNVWNNTVTKFIDIHTPR